MPGTALTAKMLCFGEIKGAKNFVKCREFMNIALPYEIKMIKNFVMKILNFIRQNKLKDISIFIFWPMIKDFLTLT